MKLKNKELLVFFGGVLLLLLFLLVQPFLQTEKKQIAVILSENAVPSFGSFQEGIYDGAEDYAFALQNVPRKNGKRCSIIKKSRVVMGFCCSAQKNIILAGSLFMQNLSIRFIFLFFPSPMIQRFSMERIVTEWNSSQRFLLRR